MTADPLSMFGKELIEQVRDATIAQWLAASDGKMKDEKSRQLAAALAAMDPQCKTLVDALIPDIVDTCLHQLLTFFKEDPKIGISYTAPGHASVDLVEASDELNGELYGRRGWIASYSQYKKS